MAWLYLQGVYNMFICSVLSAIHVEVSGVHAKLSVWSSLLLLADPS